MAKTKTKARATSASPKTYLTDDHKAALRQAVDRIRDGIVRRGLVLAEPRPFEDADAARIADEYADSLMAVAHVYGWDPEADRDPARAEVRAYLDEVAP